MNTDRRRRIRGIISKLGGIQCEIAEIESEENNSFKSLRKSLQKSKRGYFSRKALKKLESSQSAICDAVAEMLGI